MACLLLRSSRDIFRQALTMVEPRKPVSTVGFVDQYCQIYRNLFSDVRNFEAFKFLHLGMISETKRKSLPAIARDVGFKDGQSLHNFLRDSLWDVNAVREMRLWLAKIAIGDCPITLCIDETGDEKKGSATNYVAKQYISNLGKTAKGIVSVNAYAFIDGITYPLIFKVFKPHSRLKKGDVYKTKSQLVIEILRELKGWGFKIKLILADSMYGDEDVIGALNQLKLDFIVAIRSNHPVWLLPEQRVQYSRWFVYEQTLPYRQSDLRFIREIIFSQRCPLRYYQISKNIDPDPKSENMWLITTNLPGNIKLKVAQLYSLRILLDYGFKQIKNELGWADFRLTDYQSIERWWEIIFSAYLLVSLQSNQFKLTLIGAKERFRTALV